jgi:hypothetical protein
VLSTILKASRKVFIEEQPRENSTHSESTSEYLRHIFEQEPEPLRNNRLNVKNKTAKDMIEDNQYQLKID